MAETKDISKYNSPGDTVIVKPKVGATKMGSIFIPEESQESNFFVVVGTGLRFESKEVKLGDTVLISGKGGDRIDIASGTYWIFPTELIIAVIEE